MTYHDDLLMLKNKLPDLLDLIDDLLGLQLNLFLLFFILILQPRIFTFEFLLPSQSLQDLGLLLEILLEFLLVSHNHS